MKEIRKQNTREEIFNGLSHAAGLIFFLVLMPWLFRSARSFGEGKLLWTAYVFGFGIIATYFSSAVYHFMPRGIWKDRWRDRKSTRLNSSHVAISYAVFCL